MRVGFIGAALGHPMLFTRALRQLGVEISGILGHETEAAAKFSDHVKIPRLDSPDEVRG